jgi:hypothetical protein
VSPWSPDNEGRPVIKDIIVDSPDIDDNVNKALTRFAAAFLEAARQEQKLISQ